MKTIRLCMLVFIVIALIGGCSSKNDRQDERLKKITIESSILGKSMISQVYLPENYDSNTKYPVLYFLPSSGGSSYTVINQFGITETADKLTRSNEIPPLIIVALGIDFSFGLNSRAEHRTVTRALRIESSHVELDEGMYEDYIINEAIPYIDEHFSTDTSRSGRYIGGYSMGGFAALYLAFNHPNLFAKVGGHSPSIFLDDDINSSDEMSWLKWLYPDEKTRAERDPVMLAGVKDLTGLSVYLDTGETDVNVEGCKKLYEILTDNQIKAEFNLFSGNHSLAYCYNYMDRYLMFYGE